MSIVVQCDRCSYNNGTGEFGGHAMYDGRFNQSFTSPLTWEGNVCDVCLGDLATWISNFVQR